MTAPTIKLDTATLKAFNDRRVAVLENPQVRAALGVRNPELSSNERFHLGITAFVLISTLDVSDTCGDAAARSLRTMGYRVQHHPCTHEDGYSDGLEIKACGVYNGRSFYESIPDPVDAFIAEHMRIVDGVHNRYIVSTPSSE